MVLIAKGSELSYTGLLILGNQIDVLTAGVISSALYFVAFSWNYRNEKGQQSIRKG